MLAVTPFVADEKPLWVTLGAGGRVTALGGGSRRWSPRGCICVSERARRLAPTRALGRLREYLGWLHESGEPLYGEIIETVVDVDRARTWPARRRWREERDGHEREEDGGDRI